MDSAPAPRRSRLRGLGLNLGLAAASVALVLGLFEIGLRLAGYEPAAAQLSAPPLFWQHDALLGWSHEPGAQAEFIGPRPFPIEFRTPVEINSLGLRGPEIAPLPPGGLRVLVLGDSLVAAFEVTQAETFVALTEQRLSSALGRPVQMINAGVRGYGTDQALLYFRERGRLLEPDVVVYMQSLNDALDNMTLHRMRRPFGKPAFSLGADGAPTLVGVPVPDYPLCSNWGLDANLAAKQLDGMAGRLACTLQMRLADHSALFTFAVMQGARNPLLARLLLRFASVAPRFHGSAPPRVAGFLPLQVPVQPSAPGQIAARYALTSALVRQLAAEVRATGADFVWIVETSELEKMDRAALERDGIQAEFLGLKDQSHIAPIYFVNDAHMNWRGHLIASLLLTDLLVRRVGELDASAARPTE